MQLGVSAERYLHDDPVTTIFKLRQLAERTSKTVAARHAVYLGERETFEETLRRLSLERIIPKQIADLLDALRKMGNSAVHDERGTQADAVSALKFAWQLSVWFHRTYHKQANFRAAPFVQPPRPSEEIKTDPTVAALAAVEATLLKQQLEELRSRLAETENAASHAKREAEEHARARSSLESELKREAEEKKIWEQLAHEAEQSASASFPVSEYRPADSWLDPSERSASFEPLPSQDVAHFRALQAEAEQAPKAELEELASIGEQAASKIDLDEAATRELIDQQLRNSGWEADTKSLRYADGARPVKGLNLAIAEWPTDSGPADYALFAGLTLVGVVEAKRRRKNVSAAVDQAERYSAAFQQARLRVCGRAVG